MPSNFWQDLWGGAQNLLASGRVYDSRTNTYAPNGVRVPRTVAGIAGQLNPIAGLIGGQLANRLPDGSTAWEQRLRAPEGVVRQFDEADAGRDGFLQDWAQQQLTGGGYNPQVTVGQPQTVSVGGGMPNIPTTPPVNTQGPWQGLGTSTGNVFQGGALGNWANGGGAPQGLHYGNGAGAGTGYGASSYTNDAWGQTALGFGVGSSAGGSGGGIALSDAQKAQRMNADGRGFAWRGGG